MSADRIGNVSNSLQKKFEDTEFSKELSKAKAKAITTAEVPVDVNNPPMQVDLTNIRLTEIAEKTPVLRDLKIADIVVTDDAFGEEVLTLSGTDAEKFRIIGTGLYLRARTVLNFEAQNQLNVTIEVDDTTVGNTPDLTVDYTLNITDVNEPPTSVYVTDVVSNEGLFGSGSETRVNTSVSGVQAWAKSAALSNGGYVTVWESTPSDGSGYGIVAQVFDALGNKVGDEIPVNTTTAGHQRFPKVAVLSGDRIAVTWTASDGDGTGVFAKIIGTAGNVLVDEFQVNETTIGAQAVEDIEVLSDGRFVITYRAQSHDGSGWGVVAKMYHATGAPASGEIPVNTTTASHQIRSNIIADNRRGFSITWSSQNQDGSSYGVYMQDFDASGNKVGVEIPVNTTTAGDQIWSDITYLADGTRVVVWQSANQDGSGTGIYKQHIAADGTLIGAETLVNTTVAGNQVFANITTLSDDSYVIVWQSGTSIFAQRYDAGGAAMGGEVLVNEVTNSAGGVLPEVTAIGDQVVFTWTASGPNVYQRIMGLTPTVAEDTAIGTSIGKLNSLDPDLGETFSYVLTNDAGGLFRLGDAALGENVDEIYVAGPLDFETAAVHSLTVRVTDGTGQIHQEVLQIPIENINEAPTVELVNVVSNIAETRNMSTPLKVADIVVTDDVPGENALSLSGADAELFEIVGTELFLKANTNIDFENPANIDHQFDVTVHVDDPALGTTFEHSISHTLVIDNVDQAPTSVYLTDVVSNDGLFGSGSETRVNTSVSGVQAWAKSAALSNGGYVTVWESTPSDGSGYGIVVQVFDALGNKVGDEIPVNTTTAGDQRYPKVAVLSGDRIAVTWTASDGDGTGVFAKIIGTAGNVLVDEFQVNETTIGAQAVEDIEVLSDGRFVITYRAQSHDGSGWGVVAKMYHATGAPASGEIPVNTTTASHQIRSNIIADNRRGFSITWSSQNQDGSSYGVYMQDFDASGNKVGVEIPVNTTTAGDQIWSDITYLADGTRVVVWQSANQDGSGTGIYKQHIAADGTLIGAETLVNTTVAGNQVFANITTLSDDSYVIVWQSGTSIFAQRYDAGGAAMGGEVLVNEVTNSAGGVLPEVTAIGDQVVFTWTASGPNVYQRIMGLTPTVAEDTAIGTSIGKLNSLDPDLGETFSYVLTNDAGGLFRLGDAALGENVDEIYVAGPLDFETAAVHSLTVRVTDGTGQIHQEVLQIPIENINEAPTVELVNVVSNIAETRNMSTPLKVADIVVTDDVPGENALSLSGADAELFEIVDNQLFLKANTNIDFENPANIDHQFDVTVHVDDPTIGEVGQVEATISHTLVIDNVDQAPTSVYLTDVVSNDGLFGSGSETRVNTSVSGVQAWAKSAALSNGGYVTVWESTPSDGSGYGIVAQVFDAAGNKVGDEIPVNTTTAGHQRFPKVAVLSGDRIAVTWTASDGDGTGVFAKIIGTAGNVLVDEFQVNETTIGAQAVEDIEVLSDGRFVITYRAQSHDGSGWGVVAKMYHATGAPASGEIPVNTTTASHQIRSNIIADNRRGFSITWSSQNQDGSSYGVYMQDFDASGNKVGVEIPVNTTTAGDQIWSDITYLADGTRVVVWQSANQDSSGTGIYKQHIAADGTLIGAETLVNTTVAGNQVFANITTLSDDSYVIVWQSGTSIFAQRYDAGGAAMGGEVLVNEVTNSAGGVLPEVTAIGDQVVFTWTASGPNVYQRIMGLTPTVAEDTAIGTSIGKLNSIDPDLGETFSYVLTNDAGGLFRLGDAALGEKADEIYVAGPLDFETAAVHSLTVRVTDGTGQIHQEVLQIPIENINEAPTVELVSVVPSIREDRDLPQPLRVADIVIRDDVLGVNNLRLKEEGDYQKFEIIGNQLFLKAGTDIDFENPENADHQFHVTVEVDDPDIGEAGQAEHSVDYTLEILDLPGDPGPGTPPNDIIITDGETDEDEDIDIAFVNENAKEGDHVATLSASPFDIGDNFTYRLLDDADDRFQIIDGEHIIRVLDGSKLNHEENETHRVLVEVDDNQHGKYNEWIEIRVRDVNEKPEDIQLSNDTVPENASNGTDIGILTATDIDDGDTFTFDFAEIDGVKQDAGGRFKIEDNKLQVANGEDLNFEDNQTHTVTIVVTDKGGKGLTYTEEFTINLEDVKEAPEDMFFDGASVDENAPAGTIVSTMSVKDDAGDTVRYELFAVDDEGNLIESDKYEIREGENVIRVKEGATLTPGINIDNLQVKAIDTINPAHFRMEGIAITVNDIPEPPTDFNILPVLAFGGNPSVRENAPADTDIATLTATGGDGSGEVTYRLRDSEGKVSEFFEIDRIDTVNGPDPLSSKIIVKHGAELNFEDKVFHDVIIEASHNGTVFHTESITIKTVNEVEIPNQIELIGGTIPQNAETGRTVGILQTNDESFDNDYTYEIVGATEPLRDLFEINGNRLVVKKDVDLPFVRSGAVAVRVTDSNGNADTENVSVNITSVAEDEASFQDLVTRPEYTIDGAISDTGDGNLDFIKFHGGDDFFKSTRPISLGDWNELGTLISSAAEGNNGPDALRNIINSKFRSENLEVGRSIVLAGDSSSPEIVGTVDLIEDGDNDFILNFGLAFSGHIVGERDTQEREEFKEALTQIMNWAGAEIQGDKDSLDEALDKAFDETGEGESGLRGIGWEIDINFDEFSRFQDYQVNGRDIGDKLQDMAGSPAKFFTTYIPMLSDSISKFTETTQSTIDDAHDAWERIEDGTEQPPNISPPNDEFATLLDMGAPTIALAGHTLRDPIARPPSKFANARPGTFTLTKFTDELNPLGGVEIIPFVSTGSLFSARLQKIMRGVGIPGNFQDNLFTDEIKAGFGFTKVLGGDKVLLWILIEDSLADGNFTVNVGFALNPLYVAPLAGAAGSKIGSAGKNVASKITKGVKSSNQSFRDEFGKQIGKLIHPGGKSAPIIPWAGVGWSVKTDIDFTTKTFHGFTKNGKKIDLENLYRSAVPGYVSLEEDWDLSFADPFLDWLNKISSGFIPPDNITFDDDDNVS